MTRVSFDAKTLIPLEKFEMFVFFTVTPVGPLSFSVEGIHTSTPFPEFEPVIVCPLPSNVIPSAVILIQVYDEVRS